MPYIKPEIRAEILLSPQAIVNAGELNYYISTLINHFIDKKGKSYSTINEVIGALECAKLELVVLLHRTKIQKYKKMVKYTLS